MHSSIAGILSRHKSGSWIRTGYAPQRTLISEYSIPYYFYRLLNFDIKDTDIRIQGNGLCNTALSLNPQQPA